MSNRSGFKNLITNGLSFIEYDPSEMSTNEAIKEMYNTSGYVTQVIDNVDHPSHEAQKEDHDTVTSPKHYTSGTIEVIDIIKDSSSPEEYEGFLANNVKKYVLRYKHKNGLEDLKKARVYLDWLIKHNETKN